ncbi:hypothetical protein LCGC14_3102010, partial [marine sediment metagenome]
GINSDGRTKPMGEGMKIGQVGYTFT